MYGRPRVSDPEHYTLLPLLAVCRVRVDTTFSLPPLPLPLLLLLQDGDGMGRIGGDGGIGEVEGVYRE